MQMHLPINRMLGRDQAHPTTIPSTEQGIWYAPIFDALANGGVVLVCCKNGMHRSLCKG